MSVEGTDLHLQEQGTYLKQQLAAVFDQLKAKDTQLSAMHQQLQAQHAQQMQRAQQAQHAQQAKLGQQLKEGQQTSQERTQVAAKEASKQSAADDRFSYFPLSHQSQSSRNSSASVAVASLQSCPNPTSSATTGMATTVQPQLKIATTGYTDSVEAADGQTPRHRFVKQRVQELQSRQSSPEKSLSSLSSRLNSPGAELVGSSTTFRVGLLEGALDSSTLEAVSSSPKRAGQSSSAGKAAVHEPEIAVSSNAAKRSNASDLKVSSSSPSQQLSSSFQSTHESSDQGISRQQARRITCASDASDRATASSASEEQSRFSSPQDRALQRISPRYEIRAQISSSSLQLPSDALATGLGGSGSGPLQWGGGLEVGSPGLELPSDEEFDLESVSDDKGATGEGIVAPAETSEARAAESEDSAQFGPEASAMSLPGQHHVPLADVKIVDHLCVSALGSTKLCCILKYYAVLCCAMMCCVEAVLAHR